METSEPLVALNGAAGTFLMSEKPSPSCARFGRPGRRNPEVCNEDSPLETDAAAEFIVSVNEPSEWKPPGRRA